jgi:predicted MFS family arabinose efflux permease
MTLVALDTSSPPYGRLLWLALGTFAIGTESFMIAGLLPRMAADLSVSVEAAGQLVTVFALAYALSSPVLTAITGRLDRRALLIASMTAFALANVAAVVSPGYWSLMAARVFLAFSAGLYVPNASALATALVPTQRRGVALSIVNGGMTLALVFGVPLGAIVGNQLGWRTTFGGVAGLATLAAIGLMVGLPRGIGQHMATVSLGARLAVVRRPDILLALSVTLLWSMGAYTLYTYLLPYLASAIALPAAQVSLVLFIWGIAAAVGVFGGGAVSDWIGTRVMVVATLAMLILVFSSLSALPSALSPAIAKSPVVIAIAIWGVTAWAFFPSQLSRLVAISGPALAPVTLSLNASFLYLGVAAGASLGSIVLSRGSALDLGWVAASCEIVALICASVSVRRERMAAAKGRGHRSTEQLSAA